MKQEILNQVQDDIIGVQNDTRGFSMVEMIIYVAIASIFFTVAIGFFWQMKQAEIKSGVTMEVKESLSIASEVVKKTIRNASDVNRGASQFGVANGVITLTYEDGDRVIDTYTKQVSIGSGLETVRVLRLTEPGASHDLTSEHTNVTNFELTDLSRADQPDIVQMELDIENVNPGSDPLYDDSLAMRFSVGVRY